MKRTLRLTTLLSLLAIAGSAHAFGIQGTVLDVNGQPVWPCDIDVIDRATNQQVNITNDSTLTNGNYNLTLPNGRYDVFFKPKIGNHIFKAEFRDQRVNNNTLTIHPTLPIGIYVSGRVIGTDAVGVNFVNISFFNSLGNPPVNVQDSATKPDGTFNALVDPNFWNIEIVPALAVHKAPVRIPSVDVVSGDVNLGDITVQNGSIITCSVSDPSLFPIQGGKLTVRSIPGRDKVFVPSNNTTASGIVQAVLPNGTYDFIAEPPPGFVNTYGTTTQYGVVVTGADVTLPNFALPVGRQLSAHVVAEGTLANVTGADIDVDWMISPTYPRVETANDITNLLGNFSVTVGAGNYRLTVQPPVATKLLPIRIPNVNVGATNLNLGTLIARAGHWVDITVLEAGTNQPIAGANIDLNEIFTGGKLTTIDDVTNASGFARIVADTARYQVKVSPPSAAYDTAYAVGAFQGQNDTTITIYMRKKTGVLGVGDRGVSAIRMAAPWPNPTHAGTRFSFAGKGEGALEILDVTGRLVATPWRGTIDGERTTQWTGSDDMGRSVPNGIYFARLRVNSDTSTRRIVIAH